MTNRIYRNPISILYNHNPFYLLSTLAVLYSLHFWQASESISSHTSSSTLASILAGFVLLLMFTGIGIVRFGGVWEDARSIFLSILLIVFAGAVSMDHLWLSQPLTALLCACGCLLATMAVTEIILASLQIKLPAHYRFSYYLILCLLFAYPIVFSQLLGKVTGLDNSWLVLAFTMAASVGFLTLLPAITFGDRYVQRNGTPWSWPAYPLSIFAVLFVAICLRSYTLCLSFVPQFGMQSGYSLSFLTPLAFTACVLMFKTARICGNSQFENLIQLLSCPIILATAIPLQSGNLASQFEQVLTMRIASPIFIASMTTVLFFFLTSLARSRRSDVLFPGSIFMIAFIPRDITSIGEMQLTHWIPLVMVSIMLLTRVWKSNCTAKLAIATAPLALAVPLILGIDRPSIPVSGVLIFLASTTTISLFRSDRWAHTIRLATALSVPIAVGILFCLAILGNFSFGEAGRYFLVFSVACVAAYEITRTRIFLPASLTCLFAASICGSWHGVSLLTNFPPAAMTGLAVSGAFLLAGLGISLAKAGLLSRTYAEFRFAFQEAIDATRMADPEKIHTN